MIPVVEHPGEWLVIALELLVPFSLGALAVWLDDGFRVSNGWC